MRKLRNFLLSKNMGLISALLLANVINFGFNSFIGRSLSYENIGILTMITSFFYITSIITNAVSGAVTHKTAFLKAKYGIATSNAFMQKTMYYSFLSSLILTGLWLIISPYLATFFHSELLPILSFAPIILLVAIAAPATGFLQGNLSFKAIGMITVCEAAIKFLFTWIFEYINLVNYVYFALPISIFLSTIMAIYFMRNSFKRSHKKHNYHFPKKFFGATILLGLSSIAFLSLDVIFAKHYLTPKMAGEYSLLSLIGKIIYFFGSLFSIFIVPLVSRDEGLNKNSAKTFYNILLISTLLTFIIYLLIGPFGFLTVPILFGHKANVIIPYLIIYGLAITFFTISTKLVTYHVTKNQSIFSVIAIMHSFLLLAGIAFYHTSITTIVQVIFFVSLSNLLITSLLHVLEQYHEKLLSKLYESFSFLNTEPLTKIPNEKRVLIFNWRDTKHNFAGGAEIYIHELARRWVKSGYDVTLFCGKDKKNKHTELIDGVKVIRRGGFYMVYIWAFIYYMFQFRNRYGIIIDCQNGIPFFTPLYATGSIYCLMFHVHQEVFYHSLIKPLAILAATLENKAMPFIYKDIKFLTISKSTEKDMKQLKLGEKGITIIYPGVDLSKLKPKNKNNIPLILYVGRLKKYKSVDVLLRATKLIKESIPNVKVIIAGEGEEYHKLIKLTKKLNLSETVTFLGKVSELKKIALYQKAWVFVNPSMMEGWGITTIEANACGTPVVASDVPGLKESIKNPHTGYLVKYGSEKLFAEKIALLITNKSMNKNMSIEAINWSKTFDWDISAQQALRYIATNDKALSIENSRVELGGI